MNTLVRLEKAIVITCSLVLAAAFCVIVLLRYGLDADLFAYEEWVLTVAFLLYFIGGALSSHDDVHIKADIIQEYITSARTRTLYQGAILLLEAVIGVVLTYFALRMFLHEFVRWPNIPTTPVYKIPLAVPRFFILAGFALMTLHAFLNAFRYLRTGLAMPRSANPPSGDTPSTGEGAP